MVVEQLSNNEFKVELPDDAIHLKLGAAQIGLSYGVYYESLTDGGLVYIKVSDRRLTTYKMATDKVEGRKYIIITTENMGKLLPVCVYHSDVCSIKVEDDPIYGGAHKYTVRHSVGFKDGKAEYNEETTTIQFVQKNDDGSMISGLQDEQLALLMLNRTEKLNKRFPSEFNEKKIYGLRLFLQGCEERVKERIDRGVMGQLKK